MSQTHETVLEIDLNALRSNFEYLSSKLNSDTKKLAVVKASAYGSDSIAIAKELVALGVDYFAVAYTSEGIVLRDAGIQTPILVLHPQPVNFKHIIERCLEPALYSPRILKKFIEVASEQAQKDYPVHLKFNTGLNRLGFWENDVDWIMERLESTQSVKVRSIFSHLAASEDLNEREFTLNQIESFKNISNELSDRLGYMPIRHQSNTSAVINYPEAQFDMVRTGIGLYGYGNDPEEDKKLKPVATLKSVISQIHKLEPGESVGYNRAYTTSGYERSATIPLGHADGIPRALGNGNGYVLIKGKKAPIIGNVCMDMLMVNITDIDCSEGDEVIVMGPENSATAVAESANTISYELLTALSHRIKRVICRK